LDIGLAGGVFVIASAGMEEDESYEPTAADAADALLASDLAQEVRAEFEGQLGGGHTVPAATGHVVGRFRNALADPHDGPVVLLALAALQWREDYLQPVIRDSAVDLVESGEAMAAHRTRDAATRRNRRELLEQFAEVLRTATVVDERAEG
jgi:hypothetical protein